METMAFLARWLLLSLAMLVSTLPTNNASSTIDVNGTANFTFTCALGDLFGVMDAVNSKFDKALQEIESVRVENRKALDWQKDSEERNSIWPYGEYGLLQPDSGCPEPTGWETGYIRHHTESSGSITDNRVSDSAHMKQPIMESLDRQFYMSQHFCLTSRLYSEGQWPMGTYCIMTYKPGVCPLGFKNGSILWDDEDDNPKTICAGSIPWFPRAARNNRCFNPIVFYCCRDDRPPQFPVELPKARPFYLHRYKDTCQRVKGMRVTDEYMHFQTEDNCNISGHIGETPVSAKDLPNVKINLCYYEKDGL